CVGWLAGGGGRGLPGGGLRPGPGAWATFPRGRGRPPPAPEPVVRPLEEGAVGPALALTRRLRREGIAATLEPAGRSLKALLRVADKRGARLAVIVGEDELRVGRATVRDLVRREDRRHARALDSGGAELASAVRDLAGEGA